MDSPPLSISHLLSGVKFVFEMFGESGFQVPQSFKTGFITIDNFENSNFQT